MKRVTKPVKNNKPFKECFKGLFDTEHQNENEIYVNRSVDQTYICK